MVRKERSDVPTIAEWWARFALPTPTTTSSGDYPPSAPCVFTYSA